MSEWDDHEAHVESALTRYTACWYCQQRMPLRDVAKHARTAHPQESLRYTNCWKCNARFPLNQIRGHAQACGGAAESEVRPSLSEPPAVGVVLLRRGERLHPAEVIAAAYRNMHARLDALDEVRERQT